MTRKIQISTVSPALEFMGYKEVAVLHIAGGRPLPLTREELSELAKLSNRALSHVDREEAERKRHEDSKPKPKPLYGTLDYTSLDYGNLERRFGSANPLKIDIESTRPRVDIPIVQSGRVSFEAVVPVKVNDPVYAKPFVAAEPAFKVGDLVECNFSTSQIGRALKVVEVLPSYSGDQTVRCRVESVDGNPIHPDQYHQCFLKPYAAPAFKKGDRCRIKMTGKIGYANWDGTECVINSVHADSVNLTPLTGSCSGHAGVVMLTEIEPVPSVSDYCRTVKP